MPIPNNLISPLLEGCSSPESILGESGLLKQLTKRIAERVLYAKIEPHLGYAIHPPIIRTPQILAMARALNRSLGTR